MNKHPVQPCRRNVEWSTCGRGGFGHRQSLRGSAARHRNAALFFLFLLSAAAFGQDTTGIRHAFDTGLAVHGGQGYVAVRDRFISDEKYAGTVDLLALSWSKFHESYDFRMWLEYQSGSALKNHNVSAEVTQFQMGLAYLYPVGEAGLLSTRAGFVLGPVAEIYVHFRRQNIATGESGSSILDTYSLVGLLSGGVRSEAYIPIAQNLQFQLAAQSTILSWGGRTVNPSNSDDSPTKLLTLFAGLRAQVEMRAVYRITSAWSAAAGYRFELARITAWDEFLEASDNLLMTVSYGF